MGKHVIILGAGASHTSGYPLAADLRILLSSLGALEKYVYSKIPIDRATLPATEFLRKWFSEQLESITLFREGGFGTIDEFGFIAGRKYREEVQKLKQIVGIILALHNPEESYKRLGSSPVVTSGFEASDYYAFIQRLFCESDNVRNDVSILTYNYDPYLDFLLSRAFRRRREASGNKNSIPPTELTSGFGDRNAKAILEGKGFCLLKLHGTAVLPPQPPGDNSLYSDFLTYEEVFLKRSDWIQKANQGSLFSSIPSPGMFFPWELIGEDGQFVSGNKFKKLEESATGNKYFDKASRSLRSLCKAIWVRAQREIAEATKISFIGMSMHRFLESGLRYIFLERVRAIEASGSEKYDDSLEIVLACPGARYPSAEFKMPPAPNSLADRLATTLCKVNPKLRRSNGIGRLITPNKGKAGSGGIVCYEDFESFIRFEL